MKPHTFQTMRMGFFFRERDGSIHGSGAYQEIVLEASPMRPVPSGRIPPQPAQALPFGRESDSQGPVRGIIDVAVPKEEPIAKPSLADAAPSGPGSVPRAEVEVPPPAFLTAQPKPPSRRWLAALAIVVVAAAGYRCRTGVSCWPAAVGGSEHARRRRPVADSLEPEFAAGADSRGCHSRNHRRLDAASHPDGPAPSPDRRLHLRAAERPGGSEADRPFAQWPRCAGHDHVSGQASGTPACARRPGNPQTTRRTGKPGREAQVRPGSAGGANQEAGKIAHQCAKDAARPATRAAAESGGAEVVRRVGLLACHL